MCVCVCVRLLWDGGGGGPNSAALINGRRNSAAGGALIDDSNLSTCVSLASKSSTPLSRCFLLLLLLLDFGRRGSFVKSCLVVAQPFDPRPIKSLESFSFFSAFFSSPPPSVTGLIDYSRHRLDPRVP